MLTEYFILEVYRKAKVLGASDEVLAKSRYDAYPSQAKIIETIKSVEGNKAMVIKKYEWIEDGQ